MDGSLNSPCAAGSEDNKAICIDRWSVVARKCFIFISRNGISVVHDSFPGERVGKPVTASAKQVVSICTGDKEHQSEGKAASHHRDGTRVCSGCNFVKVVALYMPVK